MSSLELEDIKQAQDRLKDIIKNTKLDSSATFSQLNNNQIYLKLENLQKTGSFKVRGAYNKLANLSQQQRANGVVAASAGNHAQGVALAAKLLDIKSTIIMPQGAPISKIKDTRNYGSEVILSGDTYDEAHLKEEEYAHKTGATIIPAFNDYDIIAGQGTIGLEIIEELPDIDAIVAPIGGGGLLAGIATAVKELRPEVQVIGVEASQAASMSQSLGAGGIKAIQKVDTIADGIAVKEPGDLTYDLIERYVDQVVTVNESEIAYAISSLLERAKLVVEGAGAVSLAAVISNKLHLKQSKVAVVLSGGNIDLNIISNIINRGMIKAGRKVKLLTSLADIPGSLEDLLSLITASEANVISVRHDRLCPEVSLKQAEVELVLETRDQAHIEKIIDLLKDKGYQVKKIN
ncbi:MAG: threonine ammonia-lyase [Bacillota bacterium]